MPVREIPVVLPLLKICKLDRAAVATAELIAAVILTADPAICPAQIFRTPPLKRLPIKESEAAKLLVIRLVKAAVGVSAAAKLFVIRLDKAALIERLAVKVRTKKRELVNAPAKDKTAANAVLPSVIRLASDPAKLKVAAKPEDTIFFVCPLTKDKVAVRLLPTRLWMVPLKLSVAAKLCVNR